MRIDVYLAENGYCKSRSKAAEAIAEGRVLLNGVPVQKASLQIETGAEIAVLKKDTQFVSRAGYKLEAALHAFRISVQGKTVLDIGASTGGFTDCVLQHGASYVYAVDVGSGQLEKRLLQDARVCNMENTNARYLKKSDFKYPIDLVLTDVSFISQRLLYPAVADILSPGGLFLSLIKPQFEVGRKNVGKGGIVRDPAGRLFAKLLTDLTTEGKNNGLLLQKHIASPILGGDGNREYLAFFMRT